MIKLYNADCLTGLRRFEENSIESLVTDPPAGISFMGREWDKDKGGRDKWIAWMENVARECLRILKPGAHAFVWSLPRTSHWTATAWENAGFEVRDRVAHVFGSGFPKSLDVSKAIDRMAGVERSIIGHKGGRYTSPRRNSPHHMNRERGVEGGHGEGSRAAMLTAPATDAAKQWDGWGTALKPAVEDWWLFRKPLSEKTVAQNVLKWGTGALNIDESRVGTEKVGWTGARGGSDDPTQSKGRNYRMGEGEARPVQGRWPANLIHDGSDEVMELFPQTKSGWRNTDAGTDTNGASFKTSPTARTGLHYGNDSGSAARFFYCAKPSKRERDEGTNGRNNHPTVKPLALMCYLIKLITPPNGMVLDPFMGSGTTGKAAKELGFRFIGIEKEKEYFEIAEKRIAEISKEIKLPLFENNNENLHRAQEKDICARR